jgi:N6-L-threonylcarbamoyladenine synthase
LILAIESSCDDSAIAIVEIDTLKNIFHHKITQTADHCAFGGVVPELAARLHAENLPKILELVKDKLPLIRAVAVTNAPGLTVALAEGVVMAQALSLALDIPLIAVNHLKGHIASLFIEREMELDFGVVLVSGGHTIIVKASDYMEIKEVATTIDDSLGEAFDKVSKMMGLGYPGGAIIENLALSGDENRFDFPLPLASKKQMAFSYSGLKNSVRLKILELGKLADQDKCDIAASFQKIAFKHLLDKTEIFIKSSKIKKLGVVGGVSANRYLRDRFVSLCQKYSIEPLFAPLEFCSDNGVMIARAAVEEFRLGSFVNPASIKIESRVGFSRE